MQSSCIRPTELPQASALASAVMYEPESVAGFYSHPSRDLASFKRAASEIEYPEKRRAALIEALRSCNPASPALDKLARPGVVAVMTGQQVGLFGGPSYCIYKALHAAKLAAWLSENGIPAVPVFWLATEDHDFAEVNHAWVFDAEHQPHRVETVSTASGRPVGGVVLPEPPLAALRQALEGLPYRDEAMALAESSYVPGTAMGAAFGSLLRATLKSFDILQVDPLAPAFRALAAPALAAAVEAAPELTDDVLRRGKELARAGFHAQVHVEAHTSFVFLLENGKRVALRRNGDEYAANGRRFGKRELIDKALALSPNALLRPVIQDFMLPTVAYVGGQAEIAYLAQSQVIYQKLLGRMPVAAPRTGFTILDAHSHKLMRRYGLSLSDFVHGEDALRQRIASSLAPASVAAAFRETAAEIEAAIAKLRTELAGFDVTLAAALDRSSRKINYQISKIERKAGRETLARDTRAQRNAASLYGLIYPERHLQERMYSFLPFLAKHGMELPSAVYEAVKLDCPDHAILVI